MGNDVRTIFNSEKELSTDSEDFYKNYWTDSASVKQEAFIRNKSRIERFFTEKAVIR